MKRVAIGLLVLCAACSAKSHNDAAPLTTSVATTTSITLPNDPMSPRTHDKYANNLIEFDRPTAWKSQVFPEGGLGHETPFAYLSPDELSDPCDGNFNCAWPIEQLPPGDALITWRGPAPVGFEHGAAKTVIDGEAGWLDVAKPGECKAIGADETIAMVVNSPDGGNYLMQACLRGPALSQLERDVYAMLGSVRFIR